MVINAKASIVLLTKNAGPLLREVLDGVFAQAGDFEVIVIDSGSTDATLDISRGYPVRLISIPPEEFDHGVTRNLGASNASQVSKYIVFLSQDAVPMSGWLEALVAPMEADTQVAGVFSRQVPREGGNPILKRYMTQEWEQCGGGTRIIKQIMDEGDYRARTGWYSAFSNTSSAVLRDVFIKIPFKQTDFAEDRQWAQDVLEAGYKIVYEPASAVVHSHDYTLVEQFRQNFDGSTANSGGGVSGTRSCMRSFFRLPVKLFKDAAFILGEDMSFLEKLKWILYLPFWHAATLSGALLGRKKDRLPGWLVRNLSRQSRLKEA